MISSFAKDAVCIRFSFMKKWILFPVLCPITRYVGLKRKNVSSWDHHSDWQITVGEWPLMWWVATLLWLWVVIQVVVIHFLSTLAKSSHLLTTNYVYTEHDYCKSSNKKEKKECRLEKCLQFVKHWCTVKIHNQSS